MHKSTKEILARLVDPAWSIVEDEHYGVVISTSPLGASEPCSVTVNESLRAFSTGHCEVVADPKNSYLMREWREYLYGDAIKSLKDRIGRTIFPSSSAGVPFQKINAGKLPAGIPTNWLVQEYPGVGVVVSSVLLGGETAHVTVDESSRRFALGIVTPYRQSSTPEREPDWRSGLYDEACKALQRIAADRARCVTLGSDAAKNQAYLIAAIRVGVGRLIVLGERTTQTMKFENSEAIEYFPVLTTPPTGDVMLFDAR